MRLLLAHCPRSLPITARRNGDAPVFFRNSIAATRTHTRVDARVFPAAALNRRAAGRMWKTHGTTWLRGLAQRKFYASPVSLTFLPSFRGLKSGKSRRRSANSFVNSRQQAWLSRIRRVYQIFISLLRRMSLWWGGFFIYLLYVDFAVTFKDTRLLSSLVYRSRKLCGWYRH